jgi:transcriptional regulator with XRE-family HTH domain
MTMISTDEATTFGARLRAEREALQLLPHELAHKCGVTDGAQKRMEAGKLPIQIDYLQALERFTEVDVWFVVTGERD